MEIAIIVILVLNILTLASGAYLMWTQTRYLQGWVTEAISEEIRKQDDRIQKRLQRMEGPDGDSQSTRTDRDGQRLTGMVGRPYKR